MTDTSNDTHISRLLTITEVLKIVPVSKRMLLYMVSDGRFPRPYYLTPNRCAWKEADILDWLKNLPENHRYFRGARQRKAMQGDAARKRGKLPRKTGK